jgi:hypothetical protein
VLRRKLAVLVAAAMMLASMLAISGPASAQNGCQDLGAALAAEGQAGILRENVRNIAPANDEIHFFQGVLCA